MDKANKYKGRLGMQYKTFSINSKDVNYDGESRTISGYASVFGNKDKVGDILIKGCFSKSIQDRGPESAANDKIIMLWMHDMEEPIGNACMTLRKMRILSKRSIFMRYLLFLLGAMEKQNI